jgi:DNA-binding response OmpR family regulator
MLRVAPMLQRCRGDTMKVLIIDDDPDIVDAVSVAVQFYWRDVDVIPTHGGRPGLEAFYEHDPDIVLLDVTMPDKSGFEVLQEIRRVSDVPLVMLTARSGEVDQVRGLDLGADDYVVKPFGAMTLLARMSAVLRRAKLSTPSSAAPDFEAGDLTIDFQTEEVRVKGEIAQLTAAEYKLLHHLARNAGRVMPQRALLERIWGPEWGATANNLKALVSRLRAKIETDPNGPRYIENERGLGYRFVRPPCSAGSTEAAYAASAG